MTACPLIEKILIYGPWLAAGLSAAAILGLSVSVKKLSAAPDRALFYTTLFLMLLSAVLSCLYLKYGAEYMCGLQAKKTDIVVLACILCLCCLTLGRDARSGILYVPCLLFAATALPAAAGPGMAVVFPAYVLMDASAAADMYMGPDGVAFGGVLGKKFIYLLAASAFFILLAQSGPGKTAAFAAAGMVVFMILMSNPALMAMQGGEAGGAGKSYDMIFACQLVTAFMLAKQAGAAAPYPVALIAAIMLARNIYRSITEENYASYAARDAANIVFLAPLLMSTTSAEPGDLTAVFALAALSALLQQDFISGHGGRECTVSRLKYNFARVRGGGLALFGLAAGLTAEGCMLALFLLKTKQEPAMLALVMFTAMIYAVAALNKLFIIFSMLSRIRVDTSPGLLFNKNTVRPALLLFLAAMLMISGLR
jgi:hypothetical protein